jgi:hypothetical protein
MTELQGWIVIILLIIFALGATMAHSLLTDTINGAIGKLRESVEEEIENLKLSVEGEIRDLNGMVGRAMRKLHLDDWDRD